MKKLSKINVLVSPLDWGIGHATRCVPIIKALQKNNCNVILASNGRAAAFLKNEFPEIKLIILNAYNISYPKKGSLMLVKMFLQLPSILFAVIREHYILKKIISEYDIEVVISDNRYGLWNKKTFNIFVTHQLMLKMPVQFIFCESLVHALMRFFLKKYDEIWVPDFEGNENISGQLSHKYSVPKTSYIGILSRFSASEFQGKKCSKIYDIIFILSGPEPQRSIFEKQVLDNLKNTRLKVILVRGLTEIMQEEIVNDNLIIYSHISTNKLVELIHHSKIVVSRSGYSTIMDLITLKANALLVPTPGQTEQEYLAAYLKKRNLFCFISQKEFSIDYVVQILDKPFTNKLYEGSSDGILNNKIIQICQNLSKKHKFAL